MPPRDRFLGLAAGLVRLLLVLNAVSLALFALALLTSVPLGPTFVTRLASKLGSAESAWTVLTAIRWLLVIGIGAASAAHVIFRALERLIALVRAGDPFVPEAARQIERIGWALLGLQLLHLAFGIVAWRISSVMPGAFDWQPSLTGWIAVLVAFVLARVFRLGATMRDELAGVV